ncbi:MAG: hypothetical protein NDI94_02375 [Candidatus Woesearchaeota archaeon]|nr:hypothetical protein [Candidatus Woesearchaeota archaeon]
MSKLSTLVDNHYRMLIKFYPEDILVYDDEALGKCTFRYHDHQVIGILKDLVKRVGKLPEDEVTRLMREDVESKLFRSEMTIAGHPYSDHFPLPISNLYLTLDYLAMRLESKPEERDMLGRSFRRYMKAFSRQTGEAMNVKNPIVKGIPDYDFSFSDQCLTLIKRLSHEFGIYGQSKAYRRDLEKYQGIFSLRTTDRWIVDTHGKSMNSYLSELYGEDITDLIRGARKDIITGMAELKKRFRKDVFDYMTELLSERIKGDIVGHYKAETERIQNNLRSIGFNIPDMDIEWEINLESQGVYVNPVQIGLDGKVRVKVVINPKDSSINSVHTVHNTIIHEVVAHAVQDIYTKSQEYKQFGNTTISFEGYAVHMERLCKEALYRNGMLTKKEKAYSDYEDLKPAIRFLIEAFTLTGNLNVLDGLPGLEVKKDSYDTAYRLYSRYRMMSLSDAKDDMRTYMAGVYMGAYYQGKRIVEKILGKHFVKSTDPHKDTVTKANLYVLQGAMPPWYVADHMWENQKALSVK